MRNTRANSRVSLHLDSEAAGQRVLTLEGDASIHSEVRADQVDAYVDKYPEGIQAIGMEPSSFAEEYSVAVRVRPTRARAWGMD